MKPYPAQLAAVEAAVKAYRGVVCMPTGTGKSVTMALLINALQVRTLIIVPSIELKKQLTESFTKYFGTLDNITIENIDSRSLLKAIDYDCLIIDEAHHVAASTYRNLNVKAWNGIFYRFFFTATPFRSRDEEQILMESISGELIYRLEYSDAVADGFIVPMETYYYDLPKISNSLQTWQTVYKELVVHRTDRNELICDLISNLHEQNISTLVLVKQIDHGVLLQQMCKKRRITVHFANGRDGNNKELIERFNACEFPVMLGTTGVIGEGIDTRPCEYVILAGGGKSKNQFMQNLGRGFRRFGNKASCKIIMFRDSSNRWLLEHFNACKRHLKDEYDASPFKLDI